MASEIIRSVVASVFGVGLMFVVYQELKTGRSKNMWRGWTLCNESPFAFYLTVVCHVGMAGFLVYAGVKTGISLLPK
jgi:hypothetical protein